MSDVVVSSRAIAPRPLPAIDVTIRPGAMEDLAFIDALQKKHSKQVGFFHTKTIEGKIKAGQVLIAEETPGRQEAGGKRQEGEESAAAGVVSTPAPSCLLPPASCLTPVPVGYLIGQDQYFKRDDLGVIYQINVAPGKQRGLIGATLLKAQFERSAYGCRLYCCWCAQDLSANYFWEAMGFVPLAFRTGSEKRERIHIFWQKRIRSGDTGSGGTPWWFPSKTGSGSLRKDRIVLPIPLGTHWGDAKPLVLPGVSENAQVEGRRERGEGREEKKMLPGARAPRVKAPKPKPVEAPAPLRRNGLMFDIPKQGEVLPDPRKDSRNVKGKDTKTQGKPEKVKRVCDPRMVAAARELRDRWLEQVNLPEGDRLLLTQTTAAAKYEVSRLAGAPTGLAAAVTELELPLRLPAA